MKHFSRTDKSLLSRWWWTVDRGLLVLLGIIIIFGIVLVTAASPPVALRIGLDQYHFVIRHLIVLVPSLAIMFGISLLDVKQIWRLSAIMLVGCSIALIYVLLFGMEIKGAQRWIHLPGFSLQPSEFAKPTFIVVAAWLIAQQKDKPEFKGSKIVAGVYGALVSLLVLQPDMGMTFVVTASFISVIFLAGLPFRIIFLLLVFAAGAAVLAYFSLSHVQSRVDRFLDPSSGDTFQIDKSLDAFRNGGVFGTGPGQGTVKLSIPDAHADFIFSVAGEELGLFFIVILVALYGYVLVRGFNRIIDSENMFVILAVGGLLTMFGLQALIHMGSSLHLLPTKGMTLPFISYGGSSLLSMSVAMGMVLALTRRQSRSGIAQGGLSVRPVGGDNL
ncbi:MAG TPA: putative peptidoglycan glycosyltransferase FtsW [Alphaproteobacteria bacterium]|nr:putative peptidoglycan glycosyltransferase FtsW [Alphaproteobacteria bacterium]